MQISDNLRQFLLANKIYTTSLREISLSFIASRSGYTKEIGDEILELIANDLQKIPNLKYKNAEFSKSLNTVIFTNREDGYILSLKTSNPNAPKSICLSNRLINIITASGYDSHFDDFLLLYEETLKSFRNFGKKCLQEVHHIQRSLEIIPKDIAFTNHESESNKFHIPSELKDLEFEVLFRFVSDLDNLTVNVITRLSRFFDTLGNLNNKTYDELLQTRGMGKRAIRLVRSFLTRLHTGSFEDLVKKLRSDSNITDFSTFNVNCSFLCNTFLHSKQIPSTRLTVEKPVSQISIDFEPFFHNTFYNFSELYKLDSLDQSSLSRIEKLALLELRTLYFDPVSHSLRTRNNNIKSQVINLPADIDNFLNSNLLNDSWKEIILFRWDTEGEKISLEEIAQVKNLTRERVRQILEKAFELFKLLYIADTDFYLNFFLKRIKGKLTPIDFQDICSTPTYHLSFRPDFYLAFLSDIFKTVPFKGNLLREKRKEIKPIVKKIYKLTEQPWKLKLDDFLSPLILENKLKYLHAIFASERLLLAHRSDEYFINYNKYGIDAILKSYMHLLDRPITLEEFAERLKSSPFCRSAALKAELHRNCNSNFINRIERIDEFIRVERHKWSLEKHLSYSKPHWPEIWKACHKKLESLGHQSDAGYLFRTIKEKFPKLGSKYELAHILKCDPALTNLGFLTYNLSKTGQQERITVEKVLRDIFKKDWRPKNDKKLAEEIQRERISEVRV